MPRSLAPGSLPPAPVGSEPPRPSEHGRRLLAGAAALVLLTAVAYLPVLDAGFIWDDDDHVTQNAALSTPGGLRDIWFAPRALPQYYPLVHTTFWIERRLWGLDPRGYHLVNVLLHAWAACLCWGILRRWRLPGAWLAAAVFALHPVHVESVAWITERKNVLSAVFYLAALGVYLRFAESSSAESRPRKALAQSIRSRGYWLALALFTAALLSKSVTCSLPAAILVVLWWRRGKVSVADVVPLLPFFALGLAAAFCTAWLERTHVGAAGDEFALSFPARLAIAGRAVWFYLGKLVWPHPLMFSYPRWTVDPRSAAEYVPALAALTLLGALWALRHWTGRGPLAAALFFGGTLFPALGFFNIYPQRYSYVADHFQYLASLGPIVLLVCGAAHLLAPGPLERRGRLFAVGAFAVLGVLAVLTWQQAHIYHDEETLWQDTLAKNPKAWIAHNNLGYLAQSRGDFDAARKQFEAGLSIAPGSFDIHSNLAALFLEAGRYAEALPHLQAAHRSRPRDVATNNDLGVLLSRRGDHAAAVAHLEAALQEAPDRASTHYNLANALAAQGNASRAIAEYRSTVRLDPPYTAARLKLGELLLAQREYAAALVEFAAAARAEPGSAAAHYGAGKAAQGLRQIDRALEHFSRAWELDRELLAAAMELAWIFATHPDANLRRGAMAVELAELAVTRSRGRDPDTWDILAAAYAETGRYDRAVRAAEKAGRLARQAGLTRLAAAISERLDIYREGRPVRTLAPNTPGP